MIGSDNCISVFLTGAYLW